MAKEDLFDKLGDFAQNLKDRFTLDNTDLLRAVDKNDVDEVERALNAGVDPNKDDGMGRFALPIAVDNNHLPIVELLLRAKANPNLPGKDGQSALFKAVYWENLGIVKALLQAGADMYLPNGSGVTPFEEAERNHYSAVLELMANYHDEQRARQIVADKATHEAQKAKARAARNAKSAKEQARLEREQQRKERAAQRDRKKAERNLQKKYKMQEGDELKVLIEAIRQKDDEAFRLMLDKLPDLNATDRSSQLTPLMAAILAQNGEAAQRLIGRGADVFAVVSSQKHSPLTYSVLQNYHKLVNLMLRQQTDELAKHLNTADQLLSPQFLAYKDPKMLDLLLRAGADPLFGGSAGQAPLLKAIEKAELPVLPVFVKHKVNLKQLIEGRSLLSWAIHYQRLDWLSGLLREGVDPDMPDADGRSPLMVAVVARSTKMIAALLEAHADPGLKNKGGLTVLEQAQKAGADAAIIELLAS